MPEWATNIFEQLVLPMRLYSQSPESVKSSSSSRKSKLSRDSNVKDVILARDGMISPVGRAIDKSAPRQMRQTAPERVVRWPNILPCNHWCLCLPAPAWRRLRDRVGINSPSNIFCTDPITHQSFDSFVIGVEYLNGQYRLRKIVPEDADEGPFMSHCQGGDQVIFGTGIEGNAVDLPDGELFNIRLSIATVLHESDEENYNNRIVKDEASAARISAFAVRMALLGMQSGSSMKASDYDSVDDSDSKQQERGKGLLRVPQTHR
ncbi:hypothetical protein V1525DRAFT_445328 [Lipomyces kononenkoae]|uniref:Uncharacterized protein n=1 Tax=Lipomyces kononenkoae TaxID=34357 RepID=A0ACC3SWB0_LIPKO